jgi:mannan endo-1,4-beta-mannosidase
MPLYLGPRRLPFIAPPIITGVLIMLALIGPIELTQAADFRTSVLSKRSAKKLKHCAKKTRSRNQTKKSKARCLRATADAAARKRDKKPAPTEEPALTQGPAPTPTPIPEPTLAPEPAPTEDPVLQKLYWGARIDGEVYGGGRGDAPWDTMTWDLFEQHAGKKVSLDHFGQPAPWKASFTRVPFDKVTVRGAIPYMSMSSDSVPLSSIADGSYDNSLIAWAQAAKSYGKPFFFRWNWEMNGTWFPWGAQARTNPGAYVEAWKRFHDIVQGQGATNVTWVWCPNAVWSTSTPLTSLYPGDAYVDWTCVDGYNFGTLPMKNDYWKSFYTLMKPTYDQLLALAPSKPILIGETGSTEWGGSKAAWITDMLKTQLPINFPKIRAFAWFNWNIYEHGGTYDWQIESSASAQSAFADGIALPNYAASVYGSLPPLTKVPLPQ